MSRIGRREALAGASVRAKLRKRIVIPTAAVAVVGVGLAFASTSASGARYRTVSASLGSVEQTVSYDATVAAANRSDLVFATDGTVKKVNVRTGEAVEAGEVLARLETGDLKKAVVRARGDLADAKAYLDDVEDGQIDTITRAAEGATVASADPDSSDSVASSTVTTVSTTTAAAASSGTRTALAAGTTPVRLVVASASGGDLATTLSDLKEQQSAVKSAQSAATDAIATATAALERQKAACADENVAASEADDASGDVEDASPGLSSECQAALEDVQDAQDVVADKQDALQTTLESLGSTLNEALTSLGEESVDSGSDSGSGESSDGKGDAGTKPSEGKNDGKPSEGQPSEGQPSDGKNDSAPSEGKPADGGQSNGGSGPSQGTPDSGSQESPQPDGGKSSGTTATASDLAAAQAAVDTKKTSLAQAKADLAAASLTAPFDGTIAAVDVSAGDDVSTSDRVLVLIGEGDTTANLSVPVDELSAVEVGQRATVMPAVGDEVEAEVTKVGLLPESSDGSSSTTYQVTVRFDGELSTPEGASVSVALVTGTDADVVTVPTSAVTRLTGDVGTVVVVGDDGEATRKRVTLGAVSGARIAITEGLEKDAEVAIADLEVALPSSDNGSQRGRRGGFSGGGGMPGGGMLGGGGSSGGSSGGGRGGPR